MSKLILNPFTPIPKSERSHVRGWAMLWAQRLDADIADKDTDVSFYDEFYIDHGVNFEGSLNLFGGFNDEVFYRCADLYKLYKLGFSVASLDYNIAYSRQMKNRIGSKTTSDKLTETFCDYFEDMIDQKILTMNDLNLPKQILGDSHALAFSMPDQKIKKINGQTLYSVLLKGLGTFIKEKISIASVEEIDLCFGSIDIRHHVIRNDINPIEFAEQYANQVIMLQDNSGIKINVCAPVPIEYEERRLPKSGQYKGTNFYGPREKRLTFTMKFIETLDLYCNEFDLIMPPAYWYNMPGEQYAKEIMELSSSVHIAPINYRSILGW
jgi:hypothetical protein